MSLNWKEINLILEELELEGSQIQKAVQGAFDVLCLRIYGKSGAKSLLISISPLSCRFHETFDSVPKSDKPLRFAEFLNSRIVNGRIEEAVQLGNDRVVRLTVRRGEERLRIYIRLWSNAANVIVTDMEGNVLDAMRRLPKKGEVSGGVYKPETAPETAGKSGKNYEIRDFPEDLLEGLSADASFNQKIDALYRREGGALSLESLREEARRKYEKSIDRMKASIEMLREKEADFSGAERFKEYGDIILSNLSLVKVGDEWLETKNFDGEHVRIKLNPTLSPAASAEEYYEQYRKAKSGITELRIEIADEERELARLEETLASLVSQTNPLVLHKLLKGGGTMSAAGKGQARKEDAKRPGLSFRRGNWLIVVGRDATENDALLRRYVKGNDLWLHARDYAGSYVFIKQQAGKTVPLDILLDAGNLAIFYSKGRNSGVGDLFYTQVKYLRRAKDGPKGLVIPTQEKNLHIKVDSARLRELEDCRVAK
ncbi:MAG: NFACT family protein [Treponema sp.]|jgi:predicted ribosome quality control (RQC) complex YloA/Tae2 family protein|nr:NFACT family protein [Treponema sp.]